MSFGGSSGPRPDGSRVQRGLVGSGVHVSGCRGRCCGRRGIFEDDHIADSTMAIYLLYFGVVDGDLASSLAFSCGERGSGHGGEITVGNAIEGGVGG